MSQSFKTHSELYKEALRFHKDKEQYNYRFLQGFFNISDEIYCKVAGMDYIQVSKDTGTINNTAVASGLSPKHLLELYASHGLEVSEKHSASLHKQIALTKEKA